jgi:hypothetical protein
LPDVEANLWQAYKDQGLKVVALDNNGPDILEPAGLADYVAYLGPTYPVGLEIDTTTYSTLEGIYDGSNPYPVDIVIDKNGIIQFLTREYDFDTLEAAIVPLL